MWFPRPQQIRSTKLEGDRDSTEWISMEWIFLLEREMQLTAHSWECMESQIGILTVRARLGKWLSAWGSEFGPQNTHFKKKSQSWACHPITVKADLGGSLASRTSVLKRPRPAGDNVWNRQGKGSWRGMTSETVFWPTHRHKYTEAWGPSWRTKARSREQIPQLT